MKGSYAYHRWFGLQGGISTEGTVAMQQLRMVKPTETMGIVCMLVDELCSGAPKEEREGMVPMLEELAVFFSASASRCAGQH